MANRSLAIGAVLSCTQLAIRPGGPQADEDATDRETAVSDESLPDGDLPPGTVRPLGR